MKILNKDSVPVGKEIKETERSIRGDRLVVGWNLSVLTSMINDELGGADYFLPLFPILFHNLIGRGERSFLIGFWISNFLEKFIWNSNSNSHKYLLVIIFLCSIQVCSKPTIRLPGDQVHRMFSCSSAALRYINKGHLW